MMMGMLLPVSSGAAALPGPPSATFRSVFSTPNGASQTATVQPIGTVAYQRIVFICWSTNPAFSDAITGITVTPTGGTLVNATIAVEQHASQNFGIAYAVLNAGDNATTTADVTLNYTSSPFTGTTVAFYTANAADFVSTTPTTGSNTGTSITALSTSVNTTSTSGGFTIMVANSTNGTSNAGTASGTDPFTTDSSVFANASQPLFGHVNNIGSNASSTVTATFTQSGGIGVAAASWR